MTEKLTAFIKDISILIGIMYISLFLKNALQILIGTISNSDSDIKLYKVINLRSESSIDDLLFLFSTLIIYDFLLLVIIFYFWIYLLLYLIISQIGNKLWLQIVYPIIFYLISIIYFDNFHPNILFIFIVIVLGFTNWWMFKKWIKFK